jgi:hypothetical protein
MQWQHKGITFDIEITPLGALVMASASSRREGIFVRQRPFSAIGTSEEAAVELLKKQIELEYRKMPTQGVLHAPSGHLGELKPH